MFDQLYSTGMWIVLFISISGLIFRCIRLVRISRLSIKEDKPHSIQRVQKNIVKDKNISLSDRIYLFLKGSVVAEYPVFIVTTFIFHLLVIGAPFFIKGHTVLFFQSWQVALISFSERAGDILTKLIIALLFLMIIRRIVFSYVRALTIWKDLAVLFLTAAPFITALLAYHRIGNYDLVICIHVVSGQLLLISLGWGKMGHMIFMLFSRFFIRGEYSFSRASRVWA